MATQTQADKDAAAKAAADQAAAEKLAADQAASQTPTPAAPPAQATMTVINAQGTEVQLTSEALELSKGFDGKYHGFTVKAEKPAKQEVQ